MRCCNVKLKLSLKNVLKSSVGCHLCSDVILQTLIHTFIHSTWIIIIPSNNLQCQRDVKVTLNLTLGLESDFRS